MRLLIALVPALFVLGFACSFRTQPPAGADGATIYELQNCANCHGKDREGKSLGPALEGLAANWDEEGLARFFADPKPFLAEDARLEGLRKAYPAAMSKYDNLDLEQRTTLARWLLAGR